jgi:urease accessory protein
MPDFARVLKLLHYGDSFFPTGSVSFSWGIESLAESETLTNADDIQRFISGQLYARWGCFDRTIIDLAHKSSKDLDAIFSLDEYVEILTPSSELRSGSSRMGNALLTVFARLGNQQAIDYRLRTKAANAHGHALVIQGMLWASVGLSNTDAAALSVHTYCTGLLSAGLRLGLLTHIDAQRILEALQPQISEIMASPLVAIENISNFGIEAEIAVMRQASQNLRLFAN